MPTLRVVDCYIDSGIEIAIVKLTSRGSDEPKYFAKLFSHESDWFLETTDFDSLPNLEQFLKQLVKSVAISNSYNNFVV